MIERVELAEHLDLDDYAGYVHLAPQVGELRAHARLLVPRLGRRRVWMLSSTASGGGVAEMLPRVISLLRELGVPVEWVVMRPSDPRFFLLTKRLHNLIHGTGDPRLGPDEQALYQAECRSCARALAPLCAPGDLVVTHDPQPLGAGAELRRMVPVRTIWRSHIGLDEDLPETRAAWAFLHPWLDAYEQVVFSTREYAPPFLADRTTVIAPGIDPLGHKNRELDPHKLVGVLCNAELAIAHQPVLTPSFGDPALRLRDDGRFGLASSPSEVGLLYRPTVTQVSRWDRLKGFLQLLEGFVALKRRAASRPLPPRQKRRLEIVRLILAGPDPGGVADDPEARSVLDELAAAWRALPVGLRRDVAVLLLPMRSRKQNALMVNALQRCSTVVAQVSIREGFGLTATEAMWKGVAVLGTHACGLRRQVRDRVDGRLVRDPLDADEVARVLDEMLAQPKVRAGWGRSGQRRVAEEFLVFHQVLAWLQLFAALADRPV